MRGKWDLGVFWGIMEGMINFNNNEGPQDVWADPETFEGKLHSSEENTKNLSLEQSQELLIKDLQIAREKAMNRKFQLEMDGTPEDELGKATYEKIVAGYDLEIAKIENDLRELGIETMPTS